jgi:hypothetical protein
MSAIANEPQRSNMRLQWTPLRVERDQGFFETKLGSTDIAIYRCGATEAQSVGLPSALHE